LRSELINFQILIVSSHFRSALLTKTTLINFSTTHFPWAFKNFFVLYNRWFKC